MSNILVRGTVVTADPHDTVIHDGAVLVENGKISQVGKYENVKRSLRAAEVIGSQRSLVIPGLVNTHTHLSMTLFKGILEGLTGMAWLKLAWSIESHITAEDIHVGALLGCAEMIRSGTTLFADHYFQMDNVAKAVEQSGMRGALAEAILDFGDEQRGQHLAKRGMDFVTRWNGKADGRVTCLMGPHSAYTCTPSTLRTVKEYAVRLGVPIHLHLQEHREEASRVKTRFGKRPIPLLESINFLGPDVLAAHVTFLNDDELNILARRGVNVNNNVYCKMKGGQGIARAREMLDMGINVSLGTDGPASHNNLDMFEEMKLIIAAQALRYKRPDALDARTAIRMATINGASALHLDTKTGSIEAGKDADLVVLDGSGAKSTPFYNPTVLVAQTLSGRDVTHTMVKGRLLLDDGKLVTLDEEELVRRAEDHFGSLMSRSHVRLG